MKPHRTTDEMFEFESCDCARCQSNGFGLAMVMLFAVVYGLMLKPCFGDFLDMEIDQIEENDP